MTTPVKPEDFLELVERGRRGRLKIYLGFAAGVGKTYRMLEEAHALKKRGVDVVLGFIEPHARPETRALIAGLEEVPRKSFEYRGVLVEEMDLAAVLARNPQVTIVDEVAHTNAPGSKNKKRYQDVLAILEAGINVICAFNIQHLESLNDLVDRTTSVRVRETVPDIFLKQADQIVNLDLTVEDLVERLRTGKIYQAEKIQWALDHFFKHDNLITLRELALREVAESLERTTTTPLGSPTPSTGRIMVCLSSHSPRAASLLRRGSRLAGRLNTDWLVVYVETPAEAPNRIDATAQRYLLENIEKAGELGAEVIRLQSKDPVSALLTFARSHRVAHIILGRSRKPWWRTLLTGSFTLKMIQEAIDFDLHIAALEERDHETP